jgi:DNA modification methylase
MTPTKKTRSGAVSSVGTPKKVTKSEAAAKGKINPSEPRKRELKISAANGRPMLTWVGKRPLQRVQVFPAQLIEKFDPLGELNRRRAGGLLFHGDNKEILAYLLANGYRGKVNLVYIDPPFDSGADYVRKVQLRGISGSTEIAGETYSLGEQIQYTDLWANDNYLQFMYERLLLLRELLADDGAIYVHCDYRKLHHLRSLMDEVFGPENFLNSLVWMFSTRSSIKTTWKRTHHDILFYKRGDQPVFNWEDEMVREPLSESTIEKYKYEDEIGKYRLSGRNLKGSPIRSMKDVDPRWEQTNPEWVVRDYLRSGKSASDYFFIEIENQASAVRTDYPTQKPEELLYKLISASSKPDDLILDCFIGSGTTGAVAQKLGRRWIGCDINKGSIQTTSKRLQMIVEAQIELGKKNIKQQRLIDNDQNEIPQPAQLSLSVYRVNDYDLQIQHNEAVNLTCEHIGIKRTKSDSFFDGELGKKLVKIVPFNHPLSSVDLEEIKKELDARPDDERDVVVVSLGKELTVDGWLEDWNRYRKNRNVPNKIEVIELRTDERYGKFFEHKPASGRVEFKRTGEKIAIRILDFISPTILERLQQQAGVLTPHIEDWRSMVDSIMIDTAYNGEVFNVVYSDVPERKSDLVVGKYELDAPTKKTTVAIKITDMLGEEVLEMGQI